MNNLTPAQREGILNTLYSDGSAFMSDEDLDACIKALRGECPYNTATCRGPDAKGDDPICDLCYRGDGSRFEVTDSRGDTTFGLDAKALGSWVTDAMSLPHDTRPNLLSIKHCTG